MPTCHKALMVTLFQLLQSTLTQLGKSHTANISVNRFQANLVIDQADAICHATKVWESVDNTAATVFRCTVYGKCNRVHLICWPYQRVCLFMCRFIRLLLEMLFSQRLIWKSTLMFPKLHGLYDW